MLNRWIEDELLDVLWTEGIGAIAFCPLGQGRLTDKYLDGIPSNSRAAKEHGFLKSEQITEELLNNVRDLNQIATQRKQTLAQMALAWTLRDSRVTSALIGASKVEQIVENVNALENTQFSDDQLNQIEQILSRQAS